jgi:hypothetical protein
LRVARDESVQENSINAQDKYFHVPGFIHIDPQFLHSSLKRGSNNCLLGEEEYYFRNDFHEYVFAYPITDFNRDHALAADA